jgi:hypothetical protein
MPTRLRDPERTSRSLGEFSLFVEVGEDVARHPIMRPLRNALVDCDAAQPLRPVPVTSARGRLALSALLRTSSSAVAEDLPDAVTPQVGFTVAAAVQRALTGGAEARIVLVGSSALAADAVMGPASGSQNMDFLVNAVSWLAQREETIAISGKAPSVLRLRLEPGQRRRLQLFSLVEVPLLCALAGLAVWWRRRR